MTLLEIKAAKLATETAIKTLLADLEEKSGMVVNSLFVSHKPRRLGYPSEGLAEVSIDPRLEE